MPKKKLSIPQVQLIAESLLPSFIPKNPEQDALQFNFTAEGSHWLVEFSREGKNWKFITAKEAEPEA